MGSLSIWHLLILLAVVLILFGGGGKLSRLMGDLGKGINSFKAGLREDEARRRDEPRDTIESARPPIAGTQSMEGGARQDDVVRR
jgi:sec-independent protein translocase protein TatA